MTLEFSNQYLSTTHHPPNKQKKKKINKGEISVIQEVWCKHLWHIHPLVEQYPSQDRQK